MACLYRPISSGKFALVSGSLTGWTLAWWNFFLGDLSCLSVPCDDWGSKLFRSIAFLHLVEYSPCLLCLMTEKLLTEYLIIPKGSQFSWGFFKVLGRTAPQLQAISREVCTFPNFSPVSWQRRCQWYASLISDDIFGLSIFTLVLKGGEDTIDAIQEIVSNILWGVYYRLSLSRSDFVKCCTR